MEGVADLLDSFAGRLEAATFMSFARNDSGQKLGAKTWPVCA
jgi:hypothetical protein